MDSLDTKVQHSIVISIVSTELFSKELKNSHRTIFNDNLICKLCQQKSVFAEK